MKITNATLRTYRFRETATTYIFFNTANINIELNKIDGSFVDGNVMNNEDTQKLFRALYKCLKSK
jgi:hypothetical protein